VDMAEVEKVAIEVDMVELEKLEVEEAVEGVTDKDGKRP